MILPPDVPELVDLDLLLCVDKLGSLSKAAREHRVSQPTASMRIQAVERRLGLRLLDRSPTGCRLTAAGRTVAECARAVVEAASQMATRTSALRANQRGRLRIASSLSVADYLMPSWLVTFREQFPNVAMELHVLNSREVIARLSSGDADVGFVEDSSNHANLGQLVVGYDELVVVVAPTHAWARRPAAVTLAELIKGPLVLREQGSGTRETLERALGGLSSDYPPLELGSMNAIKAAVGAGLGAGVISLISVKDELRTGQLERVEVKGVDLAQRLRAVWPGDGTLLPPAQELVAIASRGGAHGRSRGCGSARSQSAIRAAA
jgi:DNA-binding transcriptional LysR family regulator